MSEAMKTQEVLNKLRGVKKSNGGHRALCPAHDDKNPSLSVKDDNGLAVLHCFAGCTQEAVYSALGSQQHSTRVVATYDYCDEHGRVIYQKCRTEPKSFFYQTPDGSKGLNGTRTVLYRTPELLEADLSILVFVVEGEKDADRMHSLGLLATTNPGGAGKWRDEYSDALRGRPVLIIPDNDEPGRKHALKVAHSLCGKAASVKIIELPGLPEKGDVSDWLSAGGTVGELFEMGESVPTFDCEYSEDEDATLVRSFSEFMALRFDAQDQIGFELRRREIGLLASVTNVGKSTLIRNALLALACGGEFLPLVERSIPRNVGLLDFETSGSRLQSDLFCMTRHWPESERRLLNEHLFIVCEGMIGGDLFSLSHHMPVIEREAKARKLDFLAVDTASAAFNLFDENSNAEVTRRALKPLLELARKSDCAIVMAHHIGKVKTEEGSAQEKVHRPRGASAFTGYAASVFLLSPDASDPDAVTLTCAKRKSGAAYEVFLKLDRETRWFQTKGEIKRTPTNYELVVAAVCDAGSPVKRSEIDAALAGRVQKATITRVLADAVTRGDLSKDGHGIYSPISDAQMLTPIRDEHVSISETEDHIPFA